MIPRKTVTLTVQVDLDPVPGAFHTEEDAAQRVQDILTSSIPHYHPIVSHEG